MRSISLDLEPANIHPTRGRCVNRCTVIDDRICTHSTQRTGGGREHLDRSWRERQTVPKIYLSIPEFMLIFRQMFMQPSHRTSHIDRGRAWHSLYPSEHECILAIYDIELWPTNISIATSSRFACVMNTVLVEHLTRRLRWTILAQILFLSRSRPKCKQFHSHLDVL